MSKEIKQVRIELENGNVITVDESIASDLYYAKFYDEKFPRLGPLTGKTYKDKPWTKQFLNGLYLEGRKINFNVFLPIHENYLNACGNELDNETLYFKGNQTFTNNQLMEIAKNIATGLQEITNKPKIAVFVNNSIEEPAILMAASLCGGMVYFIDITKSPEDMKKSVEDFNPDVMLMDEKLMPLAPYLNENNVPLVVANTNNEFDNKHIFSFNQLMEKGKCKELKPIEAFDPFAPFLVISSSGTTGRAKPIVHSSYSVNQAALKVLLTNYSFSTNNVMMKVIPAHIGLGIITTLYTSLISGNKLAFIEVNGPEDSVRVALEFIKNFPEFKEINKLDDNSKLLMFAAPMFYRALNTQLEYFDDLAYMGCMLAAGSKMGKDELDMLNIEFAKKGCNVPICIGYGSNENCGAVTLNSNSYNANGSGGFPIIGTDVLVIDDNNCPLINEEGRIIVRSDSQFLYYMGMEEATKKTKINFNGETWVEMNDIGYMNNEGFVYITGRISRVIIKCDCKISIDTVEEKIRKNPAVKECGVIALTNNSQDIVYAFITSDESCNIEDLENEMKNNPQWLSPLERPDFVINLDEMPYMNNGKIDFIRLKELAITDYKKREGNQVKQLKK